MKMDAASAVLRIFMFLPEENVTAEDELLEPSLLKWHGMWQYESH